MATIAFNVIRRDIMDKYNDGNRGMEVAKELSDFVNNFTFDQQGFIDTITSEHRTLQQNIFRLFLGCIEEWAEMYDDGYYDARNEAICKISRQIIDMLEENGDNIPFI